MILYPLHLRVDVETRGPISHVRVTHTPTGLTVTESGPSAYKAEMAAVAKLKTMLREGGL